MPLLDHLAPGGEPRPASPWSVQPMQQQLAKSKDDDDDDDDDADDDGDDSDDDGDGGDSGEDGDDLADLDEDELKERLRETRDQLNRSTSGGAAKRKKIRRLEQELLDARRTKPLAKKSAADDDDKPDSVDVEAVKAAAKAEARTEADTRIKLAEARGALRSALGPSAKPDQVKDLVNMLDLADLDIDDDGTVDGLDDAIVALKEKWPQLFPRAIRRRPSSAGDADSGDDSKAPRKKYSTTEIQVAAALGKKLR